MDSQFKHIRIAGISSAVPSKIRTYHDDMQHFNEEEIAKIVASTGVEQKHIATNLCTSDLCYEAAEKLLNDLAWNRDSIDVLIFISQTPDYLLPATGCTLQQRLNLSSSTAAFDINLGCSGYIYGLWLAASLLNGSGCKRVLLLVGDTISRIASPQDRSVAPLFGDAGTATALEYNEESKQPWHFSLGTDGKGQEHLKVSAGGFRNPWTPASQQPQTQHDGNIRSDAHLFMNGGEIFAFTLREIPKLVQRTLDNAKLSHADVDAFVFHQANEFMLKHLMNRMKISEDKFIIALKEFGNTSSASIPLSITSRIASNISMYQRLVLVGFGVGFSWGATAIVFDKNICLPPLLLVSGDNKHD